MHRKKQEMTERRRDMKMRAKMEAMKKEEREKVVAERVFSNPKPDVLTASHR